MNTSSFQFLVIFRCLCVQSIYYLHGASFIFPEPSLISKPHHQSQSLIQPIIHTHTTIPKVNINVSSSSLSSAVENANEKSSPPTTSASQRAQSVESFKVMDILQRANELQTLGHEVLHCEVGQPESGAPKTVNDAAIAALSSPTEKLGYTDAMGLLELRETIARHYLTRYDGIPESSVDTSRIVVTTGSSGAFLLAFTAAFDTGDTIAIASSGYPCYRNILGALGCELANVDVNDEFKLTAKELSTEMARRSETGEKRIKGLILSSPSNPTGAMLTPQELKELCKLCEDEGIQFLSDEIYHGISYGKDEATALTYTDKAIIINSFSKYYSMSGWRLGWMVIPESLVPSINALQQNMFINAPTISQTAALKCWDDETITELETHVDKYRKSRTIILDKLSSLPDFDTHVAPADGGFYIYIDLGEKNIAEGLGSVAMCKAFLEEEKVAFVPGTDFEDPSGKLGDRRFRISYAGGIDTSTRALDRFCKFWPSWIERVRSAQ